MNKPNSAELLTILWSEPKDSPFPDWKELGSAITKLPVMFWEEKMLFWGAKDKKLRKATQIFPNRLRKDKTTHPIFILKKIANFGFKVCPCTSSRHSKAKYIEQGCVLEITHYKMDRNSYLLEEFNFNLPREHNWNRDLRFGGKVPCACIRKD